MSAFVRSIVFSLGMFVILLLLLVVLRRRWLAAVAFVALYTVFGVLTSVRPAIEVLCTIPVGVLLLWIMMRFGVLPLIVAMFVRMVLIAFPMTSNWSAWYVEATLLAVGIVVALVAWSSRVALAGRRVLRDELLEPAG